ncbi:MAG: retropepsin-like aspartic protease [Zymomonas mobilis]|uniref:retropepsin-like aspartic protease n=1 Tax=Zymomonas mobilis TaxID=542 RepID=UPI0039E8DCA5
MPKKYRFLLYPLLLNSVLLPPLKADKPLISEKLIEFLRSTTAEEQQNGVELNPGNKRLVDALFEGDSLLIEKIANEPETTNIVKKFTKIEALLVKGNYEEVNRQLAICKKTFFQDPNTPTLLPPINNVVMTCDQISAGNYFLEGNLPAWGEKLNNINNTYYPVIRKFKGLENFSLSATKMGSLTVFPSLIPAFTVTGIDHKQSLPIKYQDINKNRTWKIPYINASLNGKKTILLLDTESAISKLPIDLKDSPHVHIVGHINYADNGTAEISSGDLGIVDELKIGTAVLKNVPFLFTTTKKAYLGLMVLQKLGKIKINKKQMTFGKNINCNCQQDIHLGSTFEGDYQALKYPITWQGRTDLVAIDLSEENIDFNLLQFKSEFTPEEQILFEKQKKIIDELTDITKDKITDPAYIVESDLSIDGINYRKRQKLVLKDTRRRPTMTIGASILEKADLYLDFINHKACLMPNNSDTQPMPQ